MKSLEHIIREIREGKAEKGNKKSLEGAIRKVMKKEKESSFADRTTKPIDDDVGGLIGSGTGGEPKLHSEAIGIIGTDDYQGNQFKSVRTQTPHIKPPAGPGSHSQAPENVSRQRTLAKEKSSMTMHGKVSEEESIEEAKRNSTSAPSKTDMEKLKATTQFAEPPSKTDIKLGPIGEPPAPSPKTTAVTTAEPSLPSTTQKAPETTVSKASSALGKLGKFLGGKTATALGLIVDPDFGGLLPSKGETKSEFERQKEYADKTKTTTKVDTKTTTSTTTPTAKPDIKVAVPTPSTTAKPEPKVAAATPTEPKVAIPTPTTSPAPPEKQKQFKLPGVSGTVVPHDYAYDVKHRVPVKTQTHYAKKHRMHEETKTRETIENMPRKGDRKTIEYVGRKDADPKTAKEKTSRLAIIKNVIDEAKKEAAVKRQTNYENGKTKIYDYGKDVLIINPDQKRLGLDVDNNEKIPKDYDNK